MDHRWKVFERKRESYHVEKRSSISAEKNDLNDFEYKQTAVRIVDLWSAGNFYSDGKFGLLCAESIFSGALICYFVSLLCWKSWKVGQSKQNFRAILKKERCSSLTY